jgi:hypothetical protein
VDEQIASSTTLPQRIIQTETDRNEPAYRIRRPQHRTTILDAVQAKSDAALTKKAIDAMKVQT